LPRLNDHHDLGRLLVTITARKAIDQTKRHRALTNGGGRVRGDSAEAGPDGEPGFDRLSGREPSPAFAAQVVEEYRRPGDGTLRSIDVWKVEGHGSEEIAATLGCVVRTVERKLAVTRGLWQENDR
jgi:hypothetical protein